MTTEIFTEAERIANLNEGWMLFDYWTHGGQSYWCIQRLSERWPLFNSDIAAYHWVKTQAATGSERHRRAIAAHGDLVE